MSTSTYVPGREALVSVSYYGLLISVRLQAVSQPKCILIRGLQGLLRRETCEQRVHRLGEAFRAHAERQTAAVRDVHGDPRLRRPRWRRPSQEPGAKLFWEAVDPSDHKSRRGERSGPRAPDLGEPLQLLESPGERAGVRAALQRFRLGVSADRRWRLCLCSGGNSGAGRRSKSY